MLSGVLSRMPAALFYTWQAKTLQIDFIASLSLSTIGKRMAHFRDYIFPLSLSLSFRTS